MAPLLGTSGTVEQVDSDGDVRVKGKCWNPALVERVGSGGAAAGGRRWAVVVQRQATAGGRLGDGRKRNLRSAMISPLGDVFGQWPRAGWGGEDEFDRAFDASFATADQAVVLAKDVESEADADRCVALLRPRVAAEGFEAHTVQGDVSGSGAAAAGRLRVGEQVVEVSGGEFLATGEAGTLIEDDQSGVPFKVRNRAGDTHWYSERDLKRPAAVSGAAASSGRFVVGESVRIRSVAVDEARRLQDGHGE
jgi:hypothetical protein